MNHQAGVTAGWSHSTLRRQSVVFPPNSPFHERFCGLVPALRPAPVARAHRNGYFAKDVYAARPLVKSQCLIAFHHLALFAKIAAVGFRAVRHTLLLSASLLFPRDYSHFTFGNVNI